MWEERKKKKINFGNLLLYSLCLSVRPSVRPSVCPHGTIRFPLEKFPWKLIFENFSKIYRENQVILKYNKNKGYFTWWHMYIYDNISLNYSKNEKFFRKSRRDNQNIHFVSNNFFPQNSCRLWENVKKLGTARQITDDNTKWRRKDETCVRNN